MKKSGLGLLLILVMALLISAALADPQIGDPPFYKYPFLCDHDFNVPDNSYLPLGPGESNPPRGTTYSDGKWYSAHWGTLSPESYARVENGMAKLKTVTIHWNPGVFGGTIVDQGRASHLAVQLGHFKGSNTTYPEANPTARIIFNYGETIPSGTLWLDVRARILDRADMNYENVAPAANLGFNFQFQPEYRDGFGNVVLEDYDNPDFWAGGRTFPNVVHFDIFLSKHSWWPGGVDWGEEAVGWRFRHINAPSDAALHVQRVEGQMYNLNTWYNFHIDLGYCINDALQMTEDHYYSITGDPYPPPGWYTLNRLILRNIQLYTEASGALIEAEVDKAIIYRQNDAGTGGDAGNDFASATSVAPDPWGGSIYYGELYSVYDTEDWYRFYAENDREIFVSVIPPVYGCDIDLRLYNPAGVLKASAYGSLNYIDFTADSSGDWRVQLFLSYGEGQYSLGISVETSQTPPGGGGGGSGGCPYVSTWNGSQYVNDNNLIPAAEYSNGSDVTDYYLLQQPLTRYGGKYPLLIWDLDKHSFLDQVKLIAVDHEADVNVAVSPYGEILTYKNPISPVTAVNKNGTNILNLIGSQGDNQYYEGSAGDYIQLNFTGTDVQNGAKLLIRSDPPCYPYCLKSPIYIQTINASGQWQTVATIYTRLYWATDIIDLSNYLPDTNNELKVRLSFTSHDRIDFVGLDTSKQGEFELHYGSLTTANHTRLGEVKESFMSSDNQYVELLPHEQVTLQFTLPQNSKEERDFIIVLEGHYFRTD